MKKKRAYDRMMITPIALETSQCILAGSVTDQLIEPGEVTVKDFGDDEPFPTDGFDVEFDF